MSAAAGDWLHVYRALFDHPKSKRLAKRLGMDVPAAVGYLICLWTWSMAIAPDGDLSRFDPEDIEAAAGWGGEDGLFVQAATECRWFDQGKRGLLIHDWNDWAGVLVLKRARERERSAERRAADQADAVHTDERDTRPAVDHHAISGRPAVETVERPNDHRPTVGREKREKREREEKEPPLPPRPVDNPAGQGHGKEQAPSEEPEQTRLDALRRNPTCEGRDCEVRALHIGMRGQLAQIVGTEKVGQLYNPETPLHRTLAGMSGYLCAACWQASAGPGVTMEAREPICRKALVAYVDSLLAFSRQKPIRSLPAFLRTRYANMTEAPVAEPLLEQLRALEKVDEGGASRRRNGTNEAGRVSDFLPNVRAGTQSQEAAKTCNPGEAVPA